MVDFSDLKPNPSWRDEFKANDQRAKLMIDKLYDQMARGCIDNAFAESFIESVRTRFNAGLPLTDKQAAKLEELFERY